LVRRFEHDAIRRLRKSRLRRLRGVTRQAAFFHHILHADERHFAPRRISRLRRDRDGDSNKECNPGDRQHPLDVAAMT
jgi:hypothetical protein